MTCPSESTLRLPFDTNSIAVCHFGAVLVPFMRAVLVLFRRTYRLRIELFKFPSDVVYQDGRVFNFVVAVPDREAQRNVFGAVDGRASAKPACCASWFESCSEKFIGSKKTVKGFSLVCAGFTDFEEAIVYRYGIALRIEADVVVQSFFRALRPHQGDEKVVERRADEGWILVREEVEVVGKSFCVRGGADFYF